jgi:hypothetical protein
MPKYEIITRATGRRPDDNPLGMWAAMARQGRLRDEVVDRATVDSLDEARETAYSTVTQYTPRHGDAHGAATKALGMSERGGTIGPLADGTVIEVRPA